MASHPHPIPFPSHMEGDTIVSNNNKPVAAMRSAKVTISGSVATFVGFVEPHEARASKGTIYLPQATISSVLDRAARINGQRATGIVPGTEFPATLLQTARVQQAKSRTGAGVDTYRNVLSEQARLGRKALKAIRDIQTF
jgi:hypothetical protein